MVFVRIAKPVSFLPHHVAVCVRIAACVIAVGMLISFPVLHSYDFSTHFHFPQGRRALARHTPVSTTYGQAQLQLAPCEVQREPGIRVQPRTPLDNREAEVNAPASIVRTLHRLKLGPHGEADSESHI